MAKMVEVPVVRQGQAYLSLRKKLRVLIWKRSQPAAMVEKTPVIRIATVALAVQGMVVEEPERAAVMLGLVAESMPAAQDIM